MNKETIINEMLEIESNLTNGDLFYIEMLNRYIELYDKQKESK